MNVQWAVAMFVMASVGLAGCFGGEGTQEIDRSLCRNVPIDLYVTSALDGSWPVYRLNAKDNNGDWVEQRVVAMGFQLDPSGTPANVPGGLEIPNPTIRVKECDTVTLTITNLNDLAHTLHLHGGLQPWTEDGVPFLSQLPVHNGQSRTYVFEDLKAGTYWYHCHVDVAHHIDLGMYGAFIVEEREPVYPVADDIVLMLDEFDNCHIHGGINPTANRESSGGYPAGDADCQGRTFQDYYAQGPTSQVNPALCNDPNVPQQIKDQQCSHGDAATGRDAREWYYTNFPPYTPLYNTFTINGKSFPDTAPIFFEEGNNYRIRLINVGEEWHSMHLHGHSFLIAYRDGYEISHPQRADTIAIGPGERFDIIVEADNPGFWAFHDHVGLNVANDYQAPGGMFTVIAYEGAWADDIGFDPDSVEVAIDVMDWTKAYHEEQGEHAGHTLSKSTLPTARTTTSRDAQGTLIISYQ